MWFRTVMYNLVPMWNISFITHLDIQQQSIRLEKERRKRNLIKLLEDDPNPFNLS